MLFSFGLCVRVCFLNGRWSFGDGGCRWWVSPYRGPSPLCIYLGGGQHVSVCERAECCECLQKGRQLNNQSPVLL